MVPLIRREVVERHRWLEDTEFLDALAVAQAAPGPIAVSTAVYIGYRVAGPAGLAAAALGAALPSFLVLLVVAAFFLQFETNPWVVRFLAGVRPAVLALIALAAWELVTVVVKDKPSLALAAVGFALLVTFHLHPILVLLGGMVAGLLLYGKAGAPVTEGSTGEKPEPGPEEGGERR